MAINTATAKCPKCGEPLSFQAAGWFHRDKFMLDTLNAVRRMMKNRDRSESEELVYGAVCQCVETLEYRLAALAPEHDAP